MIRLLMMAFLAISFALATIAEQDSSGKNGTLKGNVGDAADAPIQTAFILVHRSGTSDVRVHPDVHGDFQLKLAAGFYDIFVAADGFAPRCKVIEMKPSKVTTYRVKLKPDSEHMQSDPVEETHPVH